MMELSEKEQAAALQALHAAGLPADDARTSLRIVCERSKSKTFIAWQRRYVGASTQQLVRAFGSDAARAASVLTRGGMVPRSDRFGPS